MASAGILCLEPWDERTSCSRTLRVWLGCQNQLVQYINAEIFVQDLGFEYFIGARFSMSDPYTYAARCFRCSVLFVRGRVNLTRTSLGKALVSGIVVESTMTDASLQLVRATRDVGAKRGPSMNFATLTRTFDGKPLRAVKQLLH